MASRLKGCRRCGGDLLLEDDEWRCWQCGQYYFLEAVVAGATSGSAGPEDGPCIFDPANNGRSGGAPGQGRRLRQLDAMLRARDRSDQRWWEKNQEIIRYLDEGRPVIEIALLAGRNDRQVRLVRERLRDLRAAVGE